MKRPHPPLFVLLAAIVLVLVTGCRDEVSAETRAQLQQAEPELEFQQDGASFAVIEGNVYRVLGGGNYEMVGRLYEPGFHARNFVEDSGTLYQVDPGSGQRYAVTRHFEEGFEGAGSVDALMSAERWHRYNTDPKRVNESHNFYKLGNRIQLTREKAHSGHASLRFHANPDANNVSKASIAKGILYFANGDDFWLSGWFYIEDTPSLTDAGAFTLFDLESSFMEYAGIRTIFRRNDSLAFELKMPKTQFEQERGKEVPFPTGQWVHLVAHVHLGIDDGQVELWQDGRQVLSRRGRTIPVAATVYDRLELGITAIAQGSKYDKVLYVDDLVINDAPLEN